MEDKDLVHKSKTALAEEATLEFWKEKRVFEQSVLKPAGKDPVGEFVFFDGPPFATGQPHYGHLIPNTVKDVVPRYRSMKGERVVRRWGWDCHGLPIENLIEKELGLKTKKDIEDYGIEKFNEAAKNSVLRYAEDWRKIIPRIGRFVDMENDYRTMDWTYTESVWWVWKSLHEKGLVTEGYKAMHLCPRCETTLANFEVNQGYKDITDISVVVSFEIVGKENSFLLAWTTTPWTLPGNVALAVNPEVEYVEVEKEGKRYFLAAARAPKTFGDDAKITRTFPGSELIGLSYKPLFDYYASQSDLKNKENGWKVYGGDFVTTEDGTGIVHIAPAFGDDDMKLGRANNLPFVQHVRTNGTMRPEVTDFAGLQVKPKDDHQSTDVAVIKKLAALGVLFSKEKIIHSYPHCWRCDTPLLNYASTSWFIDVPKIKDRLIANNQKTQWVPDNLRDGRFGNWLEGAREWAVSRSRYWGAPLPVWRCLSCEKTRVVGSVDEIKAPVRNTFHVMRHGGAQHNLKNVISSLPENKHHLTDEGRVEAKKTAIKLKTKKIDLIISSDFVRTRETAEIVREELGLPKEALVFDERLREPRFGVFEGRPVEEYRAEFADLHKKFLEKPEGGESLSDVKRRIGEFLFEVDAKYEGKTILFVTHEYPIWVMTVAAEGEGVKRAIQLRESGEDFVATGEVREIPFRRFPHNKEFEMDLHRPYIDEVALSCDCGGQMKRVPEVFDCWFESGAMPYGQIHYPFENKDKFKMPADFIAEGLDQTRGWFYSLMVLSTALFDEPTFKSVSVNGLLLGADGQKMSKRLKNYPEITHVLDRYGADALRLFLLSTPVVRAEEVAMSEKNVDEVSKKIIVRMENALQLYQLGVVENGEVEASDVSEHALDVWILARLREMGREVSNGLEKYEMDRATRPFFAFVDDFSTWYLRRSRERLKSAGDEDTRRALQTTRYVFREFSKLLAPFAPFLAERLYSAVRSADESESVHLTAWPKHLEGHSGDADVILKMERTRELVEVSLSLRQKAGFKVRQPLAKISVPSKYSNVFTDLLTDELNVKKVVVDGGLSEVLLDTELTDELRREGQLRDLMRLVQDARKNAGMSLGDKIILTLPVNQRVLVEGALAEFSDAVGAASVLFDDIETVHVALHS